MKSISSVWAVLVLLVMACGDEQQHSNIPSSATTTKPVGSTAPAHAKIEIVIDGLNGGMAYFGGIYGDRNYWADSAQVDAGGKLVLEKSPGYEGGLYFLVLPGKRTMFQVLLGEDQEFSMHTNQTNLVGAMQVDGCLDNTLLYQNLRFEEGYQYSYDSIQTLIAKVPMGSTERQRLEAAKDKLIANRRAHVQSFADQHPNTFFTKFKLAGQNPTLRNVTKPDGTIDKEKQLYYFRQDYWNDVDFGDARLLRTPVFHNKLSKYIKELTPQIGDSIVRSAQFITDKTLQNNELFEYTANYIALEYKDLETAGIMDWEKVNYFMLSTYFTPERAFWSDSVELWRIQESIKTMKYCQLGMKAKDIKCKNTKGAYESLLDLKADYIILFMWTTECEHCKEEWPKLLAYYNQNKHRSIDVYALCIDEYDTAWQPFLAQYNSTWHNVIDPKRESNFGAYYHVDITPEIYVLNKERVIIGKNLKTFQIDEVIGRDGGV